MNSPTSYDRVRAEAERRVRVGEAATFRQACAQMARRGARKQRRRREQIERAQSCWWNK